MARVVPVPECCFAQNALSMPKRARSSSLIWEQQFRETLVFKVMGKVFALTSLDSPSFSFNVKCNPEKAEELRASYTDVLPGYHMSKKHWNTIRVTGSISSELLFSWVKDSYDLVVNTLTKTAKQELQRLKTDIV